MRICLEEPDTNIIEMDSTNNKIRTKFSTIDPYYTRFSSDLKISLGDTLFTGSGVLEIMDLKYDKKILSFKNINKRYGKIFGIRQCFFRCIF